MPIFPEYLKPITIQPTNDFIRTKKPRLKEAATLSFGIFIEKKTKKEFVGKSFCDKCNLTDRTYLEKVAYDIYGYFGANIPKTTLSMQNHINFHSNLLDWLNYEYPQNPKFLHVMSELIPGYHDYCDQKNYCPKSLYNKALILPSGKQLEQKGLGTILAVSLFIADPDVVGGKGANIGFVIKKDNSQKKYAQIVKIDPGFAFEFDAHKIKNKTIRFKNICKTLKEGEIEFNLLAPTTKTEFSSTLRDICNTSYTTIEKFFIREKKYNLIKKKIDSHIEHLMSRRNKLNILY